MVTHYRWDFIGLSTDDKPTPAISEKVTDGSTFYCSDNSKLYVWYKNQWYEKTSSGGGGSYVLPIASSETLGGIKVGSNLSINSETGVLDATDTTYSAFTGTDGETAGSAGLVPAPATTDADKFLKSDGTWSTAGGGGGGAIELTSSDYNYPEGTPDGVAVWLLPAGIYKADDGVKLYFATNYTQTVGATFMISNTTNNYVRGIISANAGSVMYMDGVNSVTGAKEKTTNNHGAILFEDIADNLTTNDSKKVLSAKQGRSLNNKIGDLSTLATTDKTSIVGAINEIVSRL